MSRMFKQETYASRVIVGALVQVLERTNRLLGATGVKVRVASAGNWGVPAPSWTDGKTIYFDDGGGVFKKIRESGFITFNDMILILGMNYHELAHVLYTPIGSDLQRKLSKDSGINRAFMILEDMRIETFITSKYRPMVTYFTAMMDKIVLSGTEEGSIESKFMNFALTHGRKYLPQTLRETAAKEFADNWNNTQEVLSDIADYKNIVDEYNLCVYPDDQDRMMSLTMRADIIITKYLPQNSGGACGGFTTGREGEGMPQPDTSDGKGKGQGTGEGQGTGPISKEEAKEAQDQAEGGSGEVDGGVASGAGIGEGNGPKSFDEGLEKVVSEAQNLQMEDIIDKLRSVQKAKENYVVSDQQIDQSYKSSSFKRAPLPEEVTSSRRIYQEFNKLKVKLAPGWNLRRNTGKVDTNHISRIKRGDTDVFRNWNDGVNNALDFEVVILLDTSGSMSGSMSSASGALWCIHNALDKHKASTTVLGFSYSMEVLHQRFSKVSKSQVDVFDAGGGTHVTDALREAGSIFHSSRRKSKVLIVVSDGGFSDQETARRLIESIGVPTMMVGIGFRVENSYSTWKNVKACKTISEPIDLVPLTQKFVSSTAKEMNSNGRRK